MHQKNKFTSLLFYYVCSVKPSYSCPGFLKQNWKMDLQVSEYLCWRNKEGYDWIKKSVKWAGDKNTILFFMKQTSESIRNAVFCLRHFV